MAKVIIYLKDCELTALNTLAQREYRPIKAQAALIIRNELERLGLVPEESSIHGTKDSAEPIPSPADSLSEMPGSARTVRG